MHTSLRFFRYFVFGSFLACSGIIATAAIWNLNLLQEALFTASSSPLRIDAYLVFVGCAGLVLILPILFCELAQKSIFLVSVWFECIWVALFCIMELGGAAAASAAGADELCSPLYWIAIRIDRDAICTSSQVLQAFSWICSLLLLTYLVLLFTTTLLRHRDDDTIWRCNAGRFPWEGAQHKLNAPSSPTAPYFQDKPAVHRKWGSRSGRRSGAFSIAAPRPFNAATNAVRQAVLSYTSSQSADIINEGGLPTHAKRETYYGHSEKVSVPEVVPEERPLPPAPLPLAPQPPSMVTRQATAVTFGHSFYPQHMQSVLGTEPERQPPVQLRPPAHATRQPPSPSPIGDWPRMSPFTPKRQRKSNGLPPLVAAQVEETRHRRQQSFPPLQVDSPAQSNLQRERQQTYPLPSRPSVSKVVRPRPTFDFESSAAPLVRSSTLKSPPASAIHPSTSTQPLPDRSFSSRTRPSRPRRPSLEENRISAQFDP